MSLFAPLGIDVSLHMEAPVEEVWALVSDVTRIGEFSPETFEAKWTRGSTGPEVGATFSGHVKRNGVGPTYWSPCVVTRCVENEVFEFVVGTEKVAATKWGYRLESVPHEQGTGTKVTEYFELQPMLPLRLYWAVLGHLRGRSNERDMLTTLERMKKVVEA